MTESVFKIRDSATGKFWSGSYSRAVFSDQGISWKKRDGAENIIRHFLRYRSKYPSSKNFGVPDAWEIVEFELIENEKSTHSIVDLVNFTRLKAEVDSHNPKMGSFLEKMRKKGVLDKIEYLIQLKGENEFYNYVNIDIIKNARALLRGLGVKTRTFREGGGVFGMMDRAQALKARMVLDVKDSLDLREIRDKLKI